MRAGNRLKIRICGESAIDRIGKIPVYEHGVLRPLEPLVLSEHQRVHLTIDEKPAPLSGECAGPLNERREEL